MELEALSKKKEIEKERKRTYEDRVTMVQKAKGTAIRCSASPKVMNIWPLPVRAGDHSASLFDRYLISFL